MSHVEYKQKDITELAYQQMLSSYGMRQGFGLCYSPAPEEKVCFTLLSLLAPSILSWNIKRL